MYFLKKTINIYKHISIYINTKSPYMVQLFDLSPFPPRAPPSGLAKQREELRKMPISGGDLRSFLKKVEVELWQRPGSLSFSLGLTVNSESQAHDVVSSYS